MNEFVSRSFVNAKKRIMVVERRLEEMQGKLDEQNELERIGLQQLLNVSIISPQQVPRPVSENLDDAEFSYGTIIISKYFALCIFQAATCMVIDNSSWDVPQDIELAW